MKVRLMFGGLRDYREFIQSAYAKAKAKINRELLWTFRNNFMIISQTSNCCIRHLEPNKAYILSTKNDGVIKGRSCWWEHLFGFNYYGWAHKSVQTTTLKLRLISIWICNNKVKETDLTENDIKKLRKAISPIKE